MDTQSITKDLPTTLETLVVISYRDSGKMSSKKYTVEEALKLVWLSSDKDAVAQSEGFNSSEEEEYRNKRDPFEDRLVYLFYKKYA